MKTSLSYSSKDWTALDTYSTKTRNTAKLLIPKDTLRGNLYAAVGHFLEATLILVREGTVKAAP